MVKRAMLVQNILLFSAVYQILIGILLFVFPGAILNLMNGMEILYPYISIPQISFFKVLGILSLVFSGLQIIYGVLYMLIKSHTWSKLVGYVIGAFMVMYLPMGTLFGIIFLMELIRPRADAPNPEIPEVAKKQLSSSISQLLMVSGLLMINMPLVLFFMQFVIITMPIDMAYPLLPAVFTEWWRVIAWILLSLMILQIAVGSLFVKFAASKWMRWLSFGFGFFQMISLGIFFQFLLYNLGLQIETEGVVQIIFNFGGLLGILLNPIGLFFGFNTMKAIMQYSTLIENESKSN